MSVIGDGHSSDAETSAPASQPAPEATSDGSDSVLGGNQGLVSVDVPVTVGGNAVSVIGDSHSSDADTTGGSTSGGSGDVTTDGTDSLGGGNQVEAPVSAPVTVGGNAVSIIETATPRTPPPPAAPPRVCGVVDVETDGTDSLGVGQPG